MGGFWLLNLEPTNFAPVGLKMDGIRESSISSHISCFLTSQ